jgi:hypothetical protein
MEWSGLTPDVNGDLIMEWDLSGNLPGGTAGIDTVFSGLLNAMRIEVTPIPEPNALALFGLGLLGLIGFRRRRQA